MFEDKFDKIIEYLEDLSKRVSNIESSLTTKKTETLVAQDSPKLVREESFMEFFKKYPAGKETDKTLVIMYFLESRRNILNITTKDISDGFKEVREKIPTNVADKIQMLHKKGLIAPGENVDNLRGWRITGTGIEYLEKLKNEN